MASLTIRKLDEGIKAYLRLRSAKNGRSVEEEVRVILREYLEGSPVPAGASLAPAEAPSPAPQRASTTDILTWGLIDLWPNPQPTPTATDNGD